MRNNTEGIGAFLVVTRTLAEIIALANRGTRASAKFWNPPLLTPGA